ncbi:MAG TPA: sigma-70 family RNA polymerase sigma factor [Dehalococcoidia bacterium]|nr:sigma-70 family RNA polymerase sigma factor [Dehalococcoidia bacterium]
MEATTWGIPLTRSLEEPRAGNTAAATPAGDGRLAQPQQEVVAEWELVRRAQQFDEDAIHNLYQTYYPKIYNYAFMQMGDVQAAEDLASDVMLKMIEAIGTYKFQGLPFGAWVFRIARNRIIDLHRRRKRRGEVDLSETISTALANPQVLAERALERGQIQIALKHLTPEQRQVIVLKFIEGFDNRSVGKIMGRSEGAIKSLQHRALGALRRIMQPDKI